jgi:hypothetical protein
MSGFDKSFAGLAASVLTNEDISFPKQYQEPVDGSLRVTAF